MRWEGRGKEFHFQNVPFPCNLSRMLVLIVCEHKVRAVSPLGENRVSTNGGFPASTPSEVNYL